MIIALLLLGARYAWRQWIKRKAYMEAVSEFRWSDNISPVEFEHHCADYLSQRGWRAGTTKGSGDQGVDVLASKSGVKVVLQCKKYSKPVGNKAAQEAHAAMAFAGAHRAAVVSNAAYTTGAKQLAKATGVLLLHFTDLARADELFGVPSATSTSRFAKFGATFLRTGAQRTQIRCPDCNTYLALPKGKNGIVNCPRCKHRFQAKT